MSGGTGGGLSKNEIRTDGNELFLALPVYKLLEHIERMAGNKGCRLVNVGQWRIVD